MAIARLRSLLASHLRALPLGITIRDVILASFPRSGSTWFRFAFANALKVKYHLDRDVNFNTIEIFSPAVGGILTNTVEPNVPLRLIKTHQVFTRKYNAYRNLVLCRNPVTSLSSYFDFLSRAEEITFESDIQFVKSKKFGASAWLDFYNSWSSVSDFVVRFEDWAKDPLEMLMTVSKYYEMDFERHELDQALQLCSREHMAALHSIGDPYSRKPYEFVRAQKTSSKRAVLSNVSESLIMDTCFALYSELETGPRNRVRL